MESSDGPRDSSSLYLEPGPADRILRVQACGVEIKRRMGTIIGQAMLQKALRAAAHPPEDFDLEDFIMLTERLAKAASAFLSRDELKDLRRALKRAAHPNEEGGR